MKWFARSHRAELEFECSNVILELLVTIECDLETTVLGFGENGRTEELRLMEREESTVDGREDVGSVIGVEDVVE